MGGGGVVLTGSRRRRSGGGGVLYLREVGVHVVGGGGVSTYGKSAYT